MSVERKKLVWEIKKELHALTACELFELTRHIQLPGVTHSDTTSTELRAETQTNKYQKLLSCYEELSRKLAACQTSPASTTPDQPSSTEPRYMTPTQHTHTYQPASAAHSRADAMFSLRDLSLLQRREFKIHGGQVGDHASDISYSSLCKQIEESPMSNHTESEIIQGIFRIIKPRHAHQRE
ncbi:hypothetical protein N1851_010299 [Merluccius polli]|uniref:Uncharacterized protein n=1 Tax=Merluccius polli TaxID=89951 RepID=A0AA47P5N3_MERPO|nr:hypothetical protein N1851_010299 [Merluccius polli]